MHFYSTGGFDLNVIMPSNCYIAKAVSNKIKIYCMKKILFLSLVTQNTCIPFRSQT